MTSGPAPNGTPAEPRPTTLALHGRLGAAGWCVTRDIAENSSVFQHADEGDSFRAAQVTEILRRSGSFLAFFFLCSRAKKSTAHAPLTARAGYKLEAAQRKLNPARNVTGHGETAQQQS